MTSRGDIDQYIQYFKKLNQDIAKVNSSLFRKILYLIEIDTLSRAAFPMLNEHRKRVVQFIDKCSKWNDKDRFSAIQLKLVLENNKIQTGPLYDLVKNRIDSWGHYLIIRPDDDLCITEVERLATTDDRKFLNNCRYAELLYTYRNHLVHEFRQPGYGMEISNDPSTPYYHGMDHLETGQKSWELVFPVQFLHNLCEGAIDGLEAHLITNNLSPYDGYKFGTMWRR